MLLLALSALLGGCDLVVMNPTGDIAVQQRNLILASTALMLLVIVPVIAMTFIFAWRYRASNPSATYDPDWYYSAQLEVVIWTIPLLIVMALGSMTWISTHTLDPFRALARLGPNRTLSADVKPLEVQAVALDWKWLFIYPEYGIASVSEMAAPIDRPIRFRITSASVWNTFYVPALAGMIYAMPGMETQLNAVINKQGDYTGLSGQYSGPGFSRMNFRFKGVSAEAFQEWVSKAKSAGDKTLDREAYLKLEKPSEAVPVGYFGSIDNGLYAAIVGMCVAPGAMCVHEMHHIDREGGAGKDSQANRQRLDYDSRRLKAGDEPSGATVPASGRSPRGKVQPEGMKPRNQGDSGGSNAPATSPDQGQSNALPGAERGPAPAQLNTSPTERHQH